MSVVPPGAQIDFAALFEQAPGLMAVLDGPEHVFVHANAAFRNFVRCPDLVGQDVRAVLPPQERESFVAQLDQVRASRQPLVQRGLRMCVQPCETPDGRAVEHYIDLTCQPILSGDGTVGGLLLHLHDVTELQQIKAELETRVAERTAELEAYFNKAPLPLHSQDAEGRLIRVSDRWLEFMGYDSREEVLGRPVTDFLTEESVRRQHQELWPRLIAQGYADDVEYQAVKRSGEIADVLISSRLAYDANGLLLHTVAAAVDITARRKTEAQLQRLQSELIHVSRASAMGTMASMLAHELNQPLTAVANYVNGGRRLIAAQGSSDLAPTLLDALDGAAEQALRAGQIVRRLRALVARGHVSKRAESLAQIIRETEALGLVDASLGDVDYRVRLDPAADRVLADRVQIQQVLINLIRNALDAMATSPRRTLRVEGRPEGKRMVAVRVADSGPGIAPSVRDTLFAPFVTTKAGGMGVGLSICRTIVEAHGGQIWIEEPRQGGAIFAFTLPAAQPSGEGLGLRGHARDRADAVEQDMRPLAGEDVVDAGDGARGDEVAGL